MSGQTSFRSSFLSSRLFVNFTVWCRHSRVHSSVSTGTYFWGVGSQFFENGTMIMCVKSLSSALALRFAAPFKKRLKCVEGDRRGLGRNLGSDIERKCKPVPRVHYQCSGLQEASIFSMARDKRIHHFLPASTIVYTHHRIWTENVCEMCFSFTTRQM